MDRKRYATGAIILGVGLSIVLAPPSNAMEPSENYASPNSEVVSSISSEELTAHPDAQWFAVSNGQVFAYDGEASSSTAQLDASTASPSLIDDPVAWSACFTAHDEDYPLASYTYWGSPDPITIQLQCGYHDSASDTGHGWHHISAQHESQWRDRIIALASGDPTGAGWDDLMSWANDSNIGWPLVDVARATNYTRCVSAPVLMYDADGTYEYTFNPSVVFSTDTKRVITSIPSTNSSC